MFSLDSEHTGLWVLCLETPFFHLCGASGWAGMRKRKEVVELRPVGFLLSMPGRSSSAGMARRAPCSGLLKATLLGVTGGFSVATTVHGMCRALPAAGLGASWRRRLEMSRRLRRGAAFP